jgi:hypothetical protein
MKAEDFPVVNVSYALGIDFSSGGKSMHLFAVMVNVDDYRVILSDLGESSDQIHPNGLPWAFRDFMRLKD